MKFNADTVITSDGISAPLWQWVAALYDASRPVGYGIIHFTPNQMTETEAREYVGHFEPDRHRCVYMDYVNGRQVKTSIYPGEPIDWFLRERDYGPDARIAVIDKLKERIQ